MIRRSRFFPSKMVFRTLTAAICVAALPTHLLAQVLPTQTAPAQALPSTTPVPASGAATVPARPTQSVVDDRDAATELGAERMTGRPDRELILEEKAEITRGGMTLNADKATYDIVDDRVDASGSVKLKRLEDRYTGNEMKLKLDTGEGYVTDPTYRLFKYKSQGSAERIDFLARDQAVVEQGTYSTCEGPDPDWYLKSSRLDLDSGRDIGEARNAVVYFKGVPILGSPYMSFPLSDARKSGVLPPTIGATNKGGMELMVPYYFNIAPNRDLTIYPRLITQRGVQLGARGRYLGETYSGETKLEFLPEDKLTNTKRWAISSVHSQALAPGLTFNSNINAASDDDYPNDFSNTLTTATSRVLGRDVSLNYTRGIWNTSLRTSTYQVLQDPATPIAQPYDRLPQLTITGGQQDIAGFDWTVTADATRFWSQDLVRGDRVMVTPRISYPIIAPGYFITPSVSLNAASYNLENQASGVPSSQSRVLPTTSIDAGMVFERDASFLGSPATQTLEPRLFYVNTPYKDQSQIPLFDTAVADFNFAQLFSENRYAGGDRVSDANQLTAALVSRFIEESGQERLRLAVAQRFYFNDQRVIANSLGTPIGSGKSDILLAASGQVLQTLSIDSNLQYSQTSRQTSRTNYGVRWQPEPKKVLNLQYRRDVPAALELVDASAQWPIAQRFYGVGRINYSLLDKQISEGVLGLEYQADCWVFRVVAQRKPTGTGVATSALFFQLELNGLSKLGSNPLEVLKLNVPGYQPVNK
ncbi:MAG: LPS-assembly protein LptD [Janthinobacterium lividum]